MGDHSDGFDYFSYNGFYPKFYKVQMLKKLKLHSLEKNFIYKSFKITGKKSIILATVFVKFK